MPFPERIAALRKELKLSQEKFGELANVSQRTVAFWESGQRMPSHGTITRLASCLNVSVDYLLGLSDERNRTNKKQPAARDDELLHIISRIRTLPDPALARVSAFLDGIQAGQEVAAAAAADPDPEEPPAG